MGIWSSDDLALTEEQMTGSAKHVTGPWRYERLDGLGHWPQLEAPEAVNALLLDFLSGAARPRPADTRREGVPRSTRASSGSPRSRAAR